MAAIERIDVHEVFVSARTRWLFVEITTDEGLTGLGEVSCNGFEDGVRQQARSLAAVILGRSASERQQLIQPRMRPASRDLERIALSGFEQALSDLRARELGIAGDELLGGRISGGIRAYANINRGTSDRSPEGWSKRARDAVRHGHRALKLAPFDGVSPDRLAEPDVRARVQQGIDAVLAIRDAAGPEIAIAVDCHRRFTEAATVSLLRSLEPAALFWLEDPLPESGEHHGALRRARTVANRLGVRLAGAERSFGVQGFRRVVETGSLDVVLPDIRLCGGVQEAIRIAHYVGQAGIEFSLHNPAGPLLDAVSLACAAACPSMLMLEQAFQESPLQQEVVRGIDPDPIDGVRQLGDASGWGIELRHDVIRDHAVPADAEVDLHGIPGAGELA